MSLRCVQSLIEERDLERTLLFETANVVDAIPAQVDKQQVVESETPFHLNTAGLWLIPGTVAIEAELGIDTPAQQGGVADH